MITLPSALIVTVLPDSIFERILTEFALRAYDADHIRGNRCVRLAQRKGYEPTLKGFGGQGYAGFAEALS